MKQKIPNYKIAAIIPCRIESERLYGKQMQLVGKNQIILHLTHSLRKSKFIEGIVLAISKKPSNKPLVEFAKENKLSYVLGSDDDVLKRLIDVAQKARVNSILRVGSENPFIFFEGIDTLIQKHVIGNYDLSTYSDLPLGSSFELVKLSALKLSHKLGKKRHKSEYSTLFINENPLRFKILREKPPKNLRRSKIRLTVDTPEDLIVIRMIYNGIGSKQKILSLNQIIDFLDKHPEIQKINSNIPLKYKKY